MPSPIGPEGVLPVFQCTRTDWGCSNIFWKQRTDGTWGTNCAGCRERKRRQLDRDPQRNAPLLAFAENWLPILHAAEIDM